MSDDTPDPVPRLPPRPHLEWREDGVPRAQDMDDVYYSTSSGLDETREVFFAGCGLPERWADRRQFTVAELGFGTGLNMAALAGLWTMHRPAPAAHAIEAGGTYVCSGRLYGSVHAHTCAGAIGQPAGQA